MKRVQVMIVMGMLLCSGCALRFAPGETQKQNAWLHYRTTQLAANQAENEQTSDTLQQLTDLSQKQSEAFVGYFGAPNETKDVQNAAEVLDGSALLLAKHAQVEANKRPNVFDVADAGLELGIAIAALIGGVYGTKLTRSLKQAKEKAKALKEIIEGNELFKHTDPQTKEAFKNAHKNQSQTTRQLVAAMK